MLAKGANSLEKEWPEGPVDTPKTEGAVEPSMSHADMRLQAHLPTLSPLPTLWVSVSPSIYGSVAKTFPLLERVR